MSSTIPMPLDSPRPQKNLWDIASTTSQRFLKKALGHPIIDDPELSFPSTERTLLSSPLNAG